MEHLRKVTSQQLVMASCTAMIVAGVMLSGDTKLGFLPLAIAACCGVLAFAKSKKR